MPTGLSLLPPYASPLTCRLPSPFLPPSPLPSCAQVKPNVAIDTYDDHRMAMTFSLVACGGVPVIINDPSCTRKTFPTYFNVFESVVKH